MAPDHHASCQNEEGGMHTDFQLFSRVRVSRLLAPQRAVSGSGAKTRQPKVGDIGTVVEYFGNIDGATYLVESVDANGETVWMAEFSAQELVAATP
jgi:hypothetical protein